MSPGRMEKWTHYEFRSVWRLEGSPSVVFAILADLESYPAWWPEVKEATRAGGERFLLRVRSFLPYNLRFVVDPKQQDLASGLLEARLSGDLEGATRWRVSGSGSGTTAVFEEEVVTRKSSLNALAPVARPFFKANHTLMMRNGRQGLSAFLAGTRWGR